VLEDLRTTLAGLSSGPALGRTHPTDPPPAKNDAALSDLSNAISTDPMQASKRYFLWSAKQVLETFGVPDSTWEDPSGMIWKYRTVEDNLIVFKFTTSDRVLRVSMQPK
jgi:hypothetical protein